MFCRKRGNKKVFLKIYPDYKKISLFVLKSFLYFVILLFTFATSGCSFDGGPRARIGCLPTATFGIVFPDPNNLGTHGYGFGFSEMGGIVYTCKAGHIDLDHVRGNADNTRYLVRKIRQTLSKNKKGFSFNLTGEMSTHKIGFIYPQDWDTQPQKDAIIDEIAFDTAPYLSFNATVWHEIQTWFGVHYAGFEPEFNSAFSWEDVYSNLLGTQIGVEAVRDQTRSFDQAVTAILDRRLKELQVQPRETAIGASDKMRGQWYTGNFIPDVKMRNFDIGLDGSVTPTLVAGIEGCDAQPLPLAVPTLDVLQKHGFEMTYRIKPNVFEQGKMFKVAGSKKIFPEKHYPVFLEYMKKESIKKGYMYDE